MSLTINIEFRNKINLTKDDTEELRRLVSESKFHKIDIDSENNIVKDQININTNATNISLNNLKNVKRICSNYFNEPVDSIKVKEKRITT